MKTDCNPNMHRKYKEIDETHLTSKSLVATPLCSIALNLGVRGNGILRTTKPLKNALIHPMIKVCGTIIAIFPFIMFIIPSIAAGSDIGLGGASSLFFGAFRNAPD